MFTLADTNWMSSVFHTLDVMIYHTSTSWGTPVTPRRTGAGVNAHVTCLYGPYRVLLYIHVESCSCQRSLSVAMFLDMHVLQVG